MALRTHAGDRQRYHLPHLPALWQLVDFLIRVHAFHGLEPPRRRVDGALRMSGKTVVLINAAEPLPNLSFLI